MKTVDIFPWNDHFNTGLIAIDKQHFKLVEILNRLASHIAYKSSEEELGAIFDELIDYTEYHFKTEETIWHQYLPNDELNSAHLEVHKSFVDTVLKLKENEDIRPLPDLAEETLSFLARWLASHILETDRYMAHVVLALQEGLDIKAAKAQADERIDSSTQFLIDIILSIYSTLSSNTLQLMRELKTHQTFKYEVDSQKNYSDLLVELSTEFVNLPLDQIDQAINKALEKMAHHIGVDRSYIVDYDCEKQIAINTYEWCAKGIEPQINALQDVPLSSMPLWYEAHSKGEYFLIQDVNSLEKSNVREILLAQDIKSLITFPIFGNGTCKGFIGFDAVKVHHTFSHRESKLLELFSKLLNNVEERRYNESALYNERTFLKTLLTAIPDPVWLKNIDGVYLLCNTRFEDFFGAKEEDIVGKTDYDFVEKSVANSFLYNDKLVMQSGQSNINEEVLTFKNDGHNEIVYTIKTPICDDLGKVIGVLGIARDITDIKKIQRELEHKEHYQRALLDNFPFMVWLKDINSNFLALNQTMADACRFNLTKDISGKNDYDIWPKELADAYRKDDAEVLASGKSKIVEEPIETTSGTIWVETYKSPVNLEGKVLGTVGFSRDITDKKELERNLIRERDLFENYLNTVEAIIVSLDLKGNITLINRKGCELLGYSLEELIGKSWFEFCLMQPEGMQIAYPAFLEIVTGKLQGAEYFENHIVNKSKEIMLIAWHNAYLYDDEHNIIGTLSSGEDITVFREQQKRLEHMAHYDVLTKLPNRILLSDRLHQSMLQTRRKELILAVIYLDLDGFKEINDTYGHSNGDILLKVVSSRIKQILRDGDTIARFGGDEFVIVLSDLENQTNSLALLKRILDTVSQPIEIKDILMQVSASIGVAFYNHSDVLDADQLLRQADQAMYQAKLSGKNRFHIFDVQQDDDIRSHNASLEAIENAISNDEFVMYYQPKVNMRTGEVLGAEALIRWKHPEQGLLYPGAFLPIIENHYLCVALDSWVINSVFKQIAKWKKEKIDIVVSINISALKLQENDFIIKLLALLKKYPEIKASDFEFEILETSALEDTNNISYLMKECNKIGISFLLDDFGTGYSSLTYLKSLPAKQLKIDQSFVRNMLNDIDDMAILEGIIGLTNAFRRDVIAEGVESIEQGNMLLRLGCEEAQGYCIAKPMPAEKLVDWIFQWKPPIVWSKIKTISREDTAILYAITEHNIWINEVILYLEGKQDHSPLLYHEKCHFGLWLYSKGAKNYENKEGFSEVVALHHEMHDNISAFIKQYENQSLKDVHETIKKVQINRDDFLKKFNKFFLLD